MDGGKAPGKTKALSDPQDVQPELPTDPVVVVQIEAVFFKATQIIEGTLTAR